MQQGKKLCLFVCDQVDDCEMSGIPCNSDLIEGGWCRATHRYVKLTPYIDEATETCEQYGTYARIRVPK